MRMLLLDEEIRVKIAEVIAYAEANRIPISEMRRLAEATDAKSVGDNSQRCVIIQDGFRCVFSIEEHPFGWGRHLSVSVPRREKAPAPEAISLIMSEFGMNKSLDQCFVYMENHVNAINIIEPIEGDIQ